MQFWGEFGQIVCCHPQGLAPPLGDPELINVYEVQFHFFFRLRRNFTEEWDNYVVSMACSEVSKGGRRNFLILIFKDQIDEMETLPEELQTYLSMF